VVVTRTLGRGAQLGGGVGLAVGGDTVGVGVGAAASSGGVGAGSPLPAKAAAPPPTNVGQAPHASTTVSGTVAAWPAAACRTVKIVCWVLGGSVTVRLPVAPTWLPTSSSAPLAAPNCSAWSWLVGAPADVPAAMVTCKRPAPARVVVTRTLGRGTQVGRPVVSGRAPAV
jgi:hypothetical protein